MLITKCDHAGVIRRNDKLFQFYLSSNSLETVYKELADRLIKLSDGYLFIPKFILFQYPKGLDTNVKAQKSAIDILQSHELWANSCLTVPEDLAEGYLTPQDKDKDKDKDKDTLKNKKIDAEVLNKVFEDFWKQVPNKIGKGKAEDAFFNALKKPGVTAEIIIAGLPKYVYYENRRMEQDDYKPLHTSTWLNQQRWTDEFKGMKK